MSRARTLLVVVAAALLTVAVWFAPSMGTTLVVQRAIASPDAIISLSSHEWERLPETTKLALRYADARVVLTLPRTITVFTCHDCSGRVRLLVRNGIAEHRIDVVPLELSGTFGEAVAVREFAQRQHIRSLLVVTSPYHTRRALATFRSVFQRTDIVIGIQPASATSAAHPDAWWRTPYDRWYVRYEWAAMVYYAVRYGVNSLAAGA